MIPKTFHCVWLSGESLPAAYAENLARARSFHPDFEFKLWDANAVSGIESRYLREALAERKWAFATDYIRLHALNTEGGIYFDLDVKFNGNIGRWLNEKCVIGWESDHSIGPHLIVASPGHSLIREVLESYEGRSFVKADDTLDVTTLPMAMTWFARNQGLILDGRKQKLTDGTVIETVERFTLDFLDGDNVCEHQYAGGWLETDVSFARELYARHAHRNRPSRRFIRFFLDLLPRATRRAAYEYLNARYVFPGAYEAVGYTLADGWFAKLRLSIEAYVRLNENAPLKFRSAFHKMRREKVKSAQVPVQLSIGWVPRVDVIIPVYNVKHYIDRCLKSVANQNYGNFRVVIVDDGSTDGSDAIALQYVQSMPGWKYIRKENGGLGSARNAGLDVVDADLVSFIDSDDWIEPSFLTKLVSAIGPVGDIAITNYDLVTPEGRVQQRFDLAFKYEDDPIKQVLSSGLECSAWNKIYKADLFGKDRRFAAGWFEDLALIPALLASSNRIGFTDGCNYHYVQRPGSILAQSRTNLWKTIDIFQSYRELRARRDLFIGDRWEHYHRWTVARHLFISRAYNIHSEPDLARRSTFIRRYAAVLNRELPNWSDSDVVRAWLEAPTRKRERLARRIVVDAYRTGDPRLYSTLQQLRQFGI